MASIRITQKTSCTCVRWKIQTHLRGGGCFMSLTSVCASFDLRPLFTTSYTRNISARCWRRCQMTLFSCCRKQTHPSLYGKKWGTCDTCTKLKPDKLISSPLLLRKLQAKLTQDLNSRVKSQKAHDINITQVLAALKYNSSSAVSQPPQIFRRESLWLPDNNTSLDQHWSVVEFVQSRKGTVCGLFSSPSPSHNALLDVFSAIYGV